MMGVRITVSVSVSGVDNFWKTFACRCAVRLKKLVIFAKNHAKQTR